MNTTKKITVALAVMMVAAAMAAPAAMGVDYSATVLSGQNTAITASDGALGSGKAGTTLTKASSIELTNEGNDAATVSAAFTTFDGTTYGLTGGAGNVIPGTSFSLGTTGNLVALGATAASVPLDAANNVPADSVINYDAQLNIPTGQAADTYTGTVELNFA